MVGWFFFFLAGDFSDSSGKYSFGVFLFAPPEPHKKWSVGQIETEAWRVLGGVLTSLAPFGSLFSTLSIFTYLSICSVLSIDVLSIYMTAVFYLS